MRLPYKCLVLAMLLIPVEVLPQISFEFYSGLATYKMDHLKKVNTLQANSLPIETVRVDNFDPGMYLGSSINFSLSQFIVLGLDCQYNSTGSRIGQKDYSGYYAYDQIVNGILLGIEPEAIIKKNHFLKISISLMTGFSFTNLEMREAISIYNFRENNSEVFTATSIPLYTAVNVSVPLINRISGRISIGYLADTGGKFHYKGHKDAIISINNSPIKTGWNGVRISAGIEFLMSGHSKDH